MMASSGIGNKAVWNAVLEGRASQQVREYVLKNGQTIAYPVYAMPNIRLSDWMDERNLAWVKEERLDRDPDFVYAYVSAKLALEEAGLEARLGQHDRKTALIIGHENPGVNPLIDRILTEADPAEILNTGQPLDQFQAFRHEFFRLQTFTSLHYLARSLGISGPTFIVNNACASGLYALELGRQLLASGQVEAAIISCSDYAHVTEHLWLSEKGFGSRLGVLRPFDKGRDGSILGDGAATVILESERSMSSHLCVPLGLYRGASLAQDTWHLTLPEVTAHSYSKVIQEAVEQFATGEIDVLVPHGAGNTLWDAYEAAEIHRAFSSAKQGIPILAALKGYFGHTLGANSLLEAVCMLQGMREHIIPATMHFEEADYKIKLPINSGTHSRTTINRFMKTVCAYGGYNAAAVFEKGE
jgi:3-oxoacyl-(acyl-carrier-protein) synthase